MIKDILPYINYISSIYLRDFIQTFLFWNDNSFNFKYLLITILYNF